jgi:hypothetical protein
MNRYTISYNFKTVVSILDTVICAFILIYLLFIPFGFHQVTMKESGTFINMPIQINIYLFNIYQ